jgi:hypothetical protein
MFAQFGIDIAIANEDFNKILLILKILADLFSKRTGADNADVNIASPMIQKTKKFYLPKRRGKNGRAIVTVIEFRKVSYSVDGVDTKETR